MIKNYINISDNKPCLELEAYGDGKMHTVLVCLGDLLKLQALRGKIWVHKNNKSGKYYAMCRHNGKPLALHRYLTNCPKGMEVDHVNGFTLDNTRFNIRVVTHKQNLNWSKKCRTILGVPENVEQCVLWTEVVTNALALEIRQIAEEGWTA